MGKHTQEMRVALSNRPTNWGAIQEEQEENSIRQLAEDDLKRTMFRANPTSPVQDPTPPNFHFKENKHSYKYEAQYLSLREYFYDVQLLNPTSHAEFEVLEGESLVTVK